MTSSETVQPPPELESQHESTRLQVEAQPESPTVLQRPEILTRELIDRTALPDYGWLMNGLREKLERVKVYPASALMLTISAGRGFGWLISSTVQMSPRLIRSIGHAPSFEPRPRVHGVRYRSRGVQTKRAGE